MTETIQAQYIDNGDETVTDTKHGIMWMKKDTWLELGRLITWHESLELARKKNEEKFAGHITVSYTHLTLPTIYSV